jgi:hypothetical protein
MFFSIANYFAEIKQVFHDPMHPGVNTPQVTDLSSSSPPQSKEDPFKKFLEQKSKEPSIESSATIQGASSKLENLTDPFKEFLDKQKTQNSLSGVNPFEPAGKK